MMQRLTLTNAAALQIGDVFYRAGDAKKQAIMLVKKDDQAKKVIAVPPETPKEKWEQWILQKFLPFDTQVIFLRTNHIQ